MPLHPLARAKSGAALATLASNSASRPGFTSICAISRNTGFSSVDDDAADGFAFMHKVESVVYVFEPQRMGDQRIDLDFPLHVPVDDLRHIGAAARTAKGGTLPDAPGDELEGARPDLLSRARNADDDAHAPALVTAFERLAHDIDIADTFEAVIRTALGEVDEIRDEIAG